MATPASGVEIERKFLVLEPPEELKRGEASDIRQGYLVVADDGTEVRLRERAGETTLTVKQGTGRVRAEEEVELEPEAFKRLWHMTDGRRLEKRRHLIRQAELTIEVDVYTGELSGLVIAEIEFPGERAADEFDPPAWLGRELTGDPRFSSQRLASEGKPTDISDLR